MDLFIDALSWLFLLGGGFLLLTAGFGLIRLPDMYTRIHAGGIADTLAAGTLLFGLMLQAGFTLVTVKLIFILVFLFFTSPVSAYAIAQTALVSGLKPKLAADETDEAEDEKETDR